MEAENPPNAENYGPRPTKLAWNLCWSEERSAPCQPRALPRPHCALALPSFPPRPTLFHRLHPPLHHLPSTICTTTPTHPPPTPPLQQSIQAGSHTDAPRSSPNFTPWEWVTALGVTLLLPCTCHPVHLMHAYLPLRKQKFVGNRFCHQYSFHFFRPTSSIMNLLGFVLPLYMDFQGPPWDAFTNNPNAATGASPPTGANVFRAVRHGISHVPFFQGFLPVGNQPPFMFSHPFMPSALGGAFASPTHIIPNATINLTKDTQKRASQECITDQSKPSERQRGPRKKSEIVELEDAKEDVELLKSAGHWKDH